ncbi:MAG: fluoride efflux transporter CrcB [Patulibacter sp.]|nr:fluoride efflux transporter CrcB [Patulibacter sp.]
MTVRTMLALLIGGFVGTVLRALLADAWVHDPTTWPGATFAANVAGAFALGVVVAVLAVRPTASLHWRPLLGTGLCGGLTTFSTLQLELVRMLDADAIGLAAAYLIASVVVGLLAVVIGLRVGAAMPAPALVEIAVASGTGDAPADGERRRG